MLCLLNEEEIKKVFIYCAIEIIVWLFPSRIRRTLSVNVVVGQISPSAKPLEIVG